MFATGYAVNLRKLPMLHQSLLAQIDVLDDGSPNLTSWFESSIPGLYFIGMTALHNFGPLYCFVFGNEPAAKRVTRSILSRVRQVAR